MDTVSKTTTKKRSKAAMSAVELLISIAIMGISLAAIAELSTLVTRTVVKSTNEIEGSDGARIALNRICSDIRQARFIGDMYGPDKSKYPADNNPINNAIRIPAAGWPSYPWNSNMVLGDTILILQIPVFYEDPTNINNASNGMPIMLEQNHFGPNDPPVNMENLDTVVYQVVPDPERPNEFLLQVARFPGEQHQGLLSKKLDAINPPQTILKGIVGPLLANQGNGQPSAYPSVFSYLTRVNSIPPIRKVIPTAVNTETISGVAIDLNTKNTGLKTSQGDGKAPSIIGLHQETFLQFNRNMSLRNTSDHF